MGLVGPFQGPINSFCRMVRGRYPRQSYPRPFQGACPRNGNLPASTNEAPDVAWILTPVSGVLKLEDLGRIGQSELACCQHAEQI